MFLGTRLAAERAGWKDARLGRPVGELNSPDDATAPPVASISSLASQRRQVEVMVLVKATPQPSLKYGDTVCVAGRTARPGPDSVDQTVSDTFSIFGVRGEVPQVPDSEG